MLHLSNPGREENQNELNQTDTFQVVTGLGNSVFRPQKKVLFAEVTINKKPGSEMFPFKN